MGYSLYLFLLFISSALVVAFAKDLNAASFQEDVVNDNRVWLVEFYSPMCGSCSEFAPTWQRVESSMKSIATGKINIDEQVGMKLAESLGVLDEGLPNIRLFTSRNNGVSILKGDSAVSAKHIVGQVKKHTTGHARRDDGFFLKAN